MKILYSYVIWKKMKLVRSLQKFWYDLSTKKVRNPHDTRVDNLKCVAATGRNRLISFEASE